MGVRSAVAVSSLLLAVVLPGALGSASAVPDGAITARNWRTHPAIEAVRAVVEANEAAIASAGWTREEKATCEPPALEIRRTVFRDPRGRIRKLVTEGGSDDSAYRLEHDYDDDGTLRFAFGRSGAINHSIVEHRLHFREGGRLTWRDVRREGPVYTFPEEWPDAFVVREPEQAWAAPKRCR